MTVIVVQDDKYNKYDYNDGMFQFLHTRALLILRLSLGVVFFWFGVLKLFAVSPVQEIIRLAMPPFLGESVWFMFVLAFVEMLIGIAFLANRYVKVAAIVMLGHLTIATLAVLFTQGFDPRFPLLSLEGEFALKNLVLMGAGLMLIAEKSTPANEKENNDHPHKKTL